MRKFGFLVKSLVWNFWRYIKWTCNNLSYFKSNRKTNEKLNFPNWNSSLLFNSKKAIDQLMVCSIEKTPSLKKLIETWPFQLNSNRFTIESNQKWKIFFRFQNSNGFLYFILLFFCLRFLPRVNWFAKVVLLPTGRFFYGCLKYN